MINRGHSPAAFRPADPGRAGVWKGVLGRVLARQHVRAVYQPMVDLTTLRAFGFEALARPANLPDDGEVGDLFTEAQNSGLIRDLEWLCWRAALDGAKDLPAEFLLSINVSTSTLGDAGNAVEVLDSLLQSYSRPAERLAVEIITPLAIADPGSFGMMTRLCRQRGLKIALANVGPDPAMLRSIVLTSPDFIKLSRSLIERLAEPDVVAFVTEAAALCADHDVTLVAEGIETDDALDALLELGVSRGQGFLLGRPAPLTAQVEHLRTQGGDLEQPRQWEHNLTLGPWGPDRGVAMQLTGTQLVRKSLNRPEETRPFEQGKGKLEVVNTEGGVVGRATFQPGWRWSLHVKPIAKTESCEAAHAGYVISGRLMIAMDDGSEAEFGPGDVMLCPPGHDAWVVGDEPCVVVDWTGFGDYAKR